MHHLHWERHLQLQINLLEVYQVEALEGNLYLPHLLALLLEWEEVWLVMECCNEVVIAFDDR